MQTLSEIRKPRSFALPYYKKIRNDFRYYKKGEGRFIIEWLRLVAQWVIVCRTQTCVTSFVRDCQIAWTSIIYYLHRLVCSPQKKFANVGYPVHLFDQINWDHAAHKNVRGYVNLVVLSKWIPLILQLLHGWNSRRVMLLSHIDFHKRVSLG